ncbi:glycosyltransferase [Anaerovibrio lipolyticus]|uniref:glycosyltransferase n=1 Tax=Anaerovibrio lipolyticus TaxID=82374 RepID=UPI000482CF09|nr:glycosyltransferase [Anaerovibrio lipolyticus]
MKKILILALNTTNWIGGLYYKKNIVFQLIHNDYISKNYKIVVLTYAHFEEVFKDLSSEIEVIYIKSHFGLLKKLEYYYKLMHIKPKVMFPLNTDLSYMGIKTISWIPDFQFIHYPSFFSLDEIEGKEKMYKKMHTQKQPIVFSSQSALNDYHNNFGCDNPNTVVVPFVSYIEGIINHITVTDECEVLNRFKLSNIDYVYVANQFWQHKNHVVVLEAIEELLKRHDLDIKFVFTGKFADYRNSEYINYIKSMFKKTILAEHCVLLGFIDREEQIIIMKNAKYIIQPSLFEGWGTVVEDAKILDKTILLSDIPVHREQMNNKCILFNPHDPIELADLIEVESEKEHIDNVKAGIDDMYRRAVEYSKGFERLLRELDKE